MPLPGVNEDYPITVREAMTVLPFRKGDTVTLAVTDVPENIVLVSDLRRFENDVLVALGVHVAPIHVGNGSDDLDFSTGPDAITRDTSGVSFITDGFLIGDLIAISGSGMNDGNVTITGVSATVILTSDTIVAEVNQAATLLVLNRAALIDPTGDFVNKGIEVGDLIRNDTDGSQATITAVTPTTIEGTLAGGTDDDWDDADAYEIDKAANTDLAGARATTIRKFSLITDLAVYIRYDGDASAANHDSHLLAGEGLAEEAIRIVSRISMVNVTGVETPQVRFSAWGL